MIDFLAENKAHWEAALHAAFPDGIPRSACWTDLGDVIHMLTPFCAANLNHTMLPDGGGQDMVEVASSSEPDCIELRPGPNVAYICRPSQLYFEYFVNAPRESFFLLETLPIAPSGVYESLASVREELLELPDGQYSSRVYLDEGYIGHDESGNEIPIPDPHRLVVRHLTAGKFLLVAKSSLWNGTLGTYDGRHSQLTHVEIRAQIEVALERSHPSHPGPA